MNNRAKAFASRVFYPAYILALVIVASLVAQTPVPQPTQFLFTVQTIPAAIPTSNTCIVGFAVGCLLKLVPGHTDPYLCGADFSATGQTITLSDANGTPWVVNGAVLGASGAPVGWLFVAPNDAACRMFPGGVYVQAGSSGVTGRLTIKYNKP